MVLARAPLARRSQLRHTWMKLGRVGFLYAVESRWLNWPIEWNFPDRYFFLSMALSDQPSHGSLRRLTTRRWPRPLNARPGVPVCPTIGQLRIIQQRLIREGFSRIPRARKAETVSAAAAPQLRRARKNIEIRRSGLVRCLPAVAHTSCWIG